METLIQVLHLEDDPADAELVQAKIEEAGLACRMTLVQTRAEFETALGDGGMDIILADYRLPMYDGMSALRLAHERCPEIPFIFISGTMGEETAIEALTQGATDYLLKQNLSRLAAAVQRALQEARNWRERKQTREALQRSNEMLRAIIEAAPVAVIGLDLDGHVHSVWNPAAEKMLGWSAQEVMGRPLPTVLAESREEFRRFREQIRSGMTLDGVEVRRQRRDGTPVDCSIYASPLRDAQDRISGNIAVLVDITERKRAEVKLQESEERYRNIFENAVEGIFQATPGAKGRFISANPAYARILGYDSSEQLMAEVTEIGPNIWIDPQDRETFSEQVAKGAVANFEVQLRRREGRLIWVSLTARPVLGASGELSYIEGIMLDISDRKQVEEQLEKHRDYLEALVKERTSELTIAKQQAEAANQSKSDFLARMSHEIRTPLNAVTGLTNIVLKSELTAEQRDYLNKMQIASKNLLEVINDILDFSKVEAGRLELVCSPFDLDQVLEQLADLFSNRTSQKDLELIFTAAPDVPRQLAGDAGRLTQVLTNLVQNAVKFTAIGEIVVGVELADQLSGQTALRFSVSDTGPGIAADVLPTLFEPFTQLGSYLTREHEGTGLGLAICRRLVELMGGRIWAESTPGHGSSFFFTALFEMREKEKPRFSMPADLRGLKALVVDDSKSARQVLVDLLESFTFNVTAVDSGEKAVEAMRWAAVGEPYQLVLMDWKMPGMDGIEIATAMRNDPSLQRPPTIIMVTTYGRELVQEHMEKAAVNALLLKPIKPSQLFYTIMELFGRAEATVVRRAREPAVRLTYPLAGRRVLVVEDSELNRIVAMALLQAVGLTVQVAENGRVAVDKVSESPKGYYDAVLMDIQMPVMDGYEATRKIREFEKQRDASSEQPETKTPIIALTAHALKGEKEKCLAADMDDYLAKPLDEEQLYRTLLTWIASKQEEVDTSNRPLPGGASDNSPALDVKGALNRLGGRRQLYVKLLKKFAPEYDQAYETIVRHLAAGDRETASRTAHSVKGAAAAIGAVSLNHLAAELEKAISDEAPVIDGLVSVFKNKLEQTLESINGLLESDKYLGRC